MGLATGGYLPTTACEVPADCNCTRVVGWRPYPRTTGLGPADVGRGHATSARGRILDPADVLVCALDEHGDVLHWGGRLVAELGLRPVDVVGRSFASVLADRDAATEILDSIDAHGSWRGVVDLRHDRSQAPSVLLELDAVHSIIAVGVGVPVETEPSASERDAFRDGMTGVASSALLHDHLDLALARLPRLGGVVGVYFVALRNLEAVDHLHGHLVGDVAMIDMGRRLSAVVRAQDTVARYSGSEFVVVCELTDEDDVAALAGRLLVAAQMEERHLETAIGVATARVGDRSALGVLPTTEALLVEAARDALR